MKRASCAWRHRLNPFFIRASAQAIMERLIEAYDLVSIPSSSGRVLRLRLRPGHPAGAMPSQSLLHQGECSGFGGKNPTTLSPMSQSLLHQGECSGASLEDLAAKYQMSQSLLHQGECSGVRRRQRARLAAAGLNPFFIRASAQAARRPPGPPAGPVSIPSSSGRVLRPAEPGFLTHVAMSQSLLHQGECSGSHVKLEQRFQ